MITDELREILARITRDPAVRHLPDHTALLGSGLALDSLTGTLLLREIQERYHVDVAGEDLNLACLSSLAALAAFIETRIGL